MYGDPNRPFEELKGKIIREIKGLTKGFDRVTFHCDDGTAYIMYHEEDCCEHVEIEDVIGDIEDLLNTPILLAEEVISGEHPPGVSFEYAPDSFTWTFYKLATIKGSVTIRWYGESNGYYSESVSFQVLKESV